MGVSRHGGKGLLGVRCYLNASAGKIIIGRGVAIAPYTQIYSYSHHPVPGKPVMDGFKVADVVIEDDVLIGGGAHHPARRAHRAGRSGCRGRGGQQGCGSLHHRGRHPRSRDWQANEMTES